MRFPILVIRALVVTLVTLAFAADGSAQNKREPVPADFKVIEHPQSPLTLSLDSLHTLSPDFRLLSMIVRNVGEKEITAAILRIDADGKISHKFLGLPGTPVDQLGYQSGLESRGTRSLSHALRGNDGKSRVSISVDWLMFRDATTWGPDASGESARMLGAREGYRRFLNEVKELRARSDHEALRELIMRDGPTEELRKQLDQKQTPQIEGYRRGYSAARFAFRADVEGRGDLSGIDAKVRDSERELGIAPRGDERLKQMSVSYMFNSPIRFLGFTLAGKKHAFGEEFVGEGDWLTGAAIRLRNESGRTLSSVSLGVTFPETIRTGQTMVWGLRYGAHPITKVADPRQPAIEPGQEFEIVIDDDRPGSLVRFLSVRNDFRTITRAVIDLSYADDESGNRSSGGEWRPIPPGKVQVVQAK